jgi:hypothetical protein
LAHVLAIEPDIRQAAIVKRIVREKVLADVTVVDSRDAALDVINAGVPDVLLLSALLSPRDEDELIAHLRTLGGAQHVQTHTIPQLASTLDADEKKGVARGILSAFRRKKGSPSAPTGCDPDLFAEEIRTYLQSAEDKKREIESSDRTAPDIRPARVDPASPFSTSSSSKSTADEPIGEPITASSSWASPFEWKPSNPSALISQPYSRIAESESSTEESASPKAAEPALSTPEPLIAQSDSILAEPQPAYAEPSATYEPIAAYEEPAVPHEEPVLAYSEPPIASREPEPEVVLSQSEPEVGIDSEPEFTFAAAPEPARVPNHQIDLDSFPELTVVDEPSFDSPEPIHAEAPRARALTLETLIDLDTVPAEEQYQTAGHVESASFEESESTSRAFESGVQARSDVQREGAAIRVGGLGPLATWARVEAVRPEDATPSDDLRMLLGRLKVPTAVAGVRYPRGVRIRRVRVPSSQATESGDSLGPVILSKRALAQRREQAGA